MPNKNMYRDMYLRGEELKKGVGQRTEVKYWKESKGLQKLQEEPWLELLSGLSASQ